ncbi:glycosyltransferase [Paenibacillus chibensis]|uniref:Glycosyltransferase n=1 Tax=Paenibacillus chibensis TaxID=59846 RepID=A0ABU6PT81_9BACL|nr:glycosyltransferase [Paenibacillus chibensis]
MHTTIGIHLIVKDESDVLRHCLESVKNADEIIVLDTGSEDHTVSIAEEYGAQIIKMRWQNDFSAARNEALRHAGTDWILVIDADERLVTPMDHIRDLIEGTQREAFNVFVTNLLDAEGEQSVRHRSLRLFRNRPEYRFQGTIHEEIEPSILLFAGKETIRDSSVEFEHTGYQAVTMHSKNKLNRNYRILMQALDKEPDNAYYLYHAGIIQCQIGHLAEAKAYMLQARLLVPVTAAFRPTLMRDLAKIMLELNEPEEAGLICLRELQYYPDYADLHYIQAECLEKQGLLEKAMDAYRNAATSTSELYVTENGMNSYKPWTRIGDISLKLTRHEQAAKLFHEAACLRPSYSPAVLGLAAAFHRLNATDEEISELLLQIQQPHTLMQWRLLLEALDQIGADSEIVRLTPPEWITDESISVMYGSSMLRLKKFKEARSFFYHAASVNPKPCAERELLHVLSQWQLTGQLETSIWTYLREVPHRSMEWIDHAISSVEVDSQLTSQEPDSDDLVERLIQLSVAVGMIDMARKLAALTGSAAVAFAKALYQEGYTMASADWLISLLENQTLDDEGAHMLAEMIYDKGHYDEAVRLFENIVLNDPSHDRSKIGAALCYLHLAAACLQLTQSTTPEKDVLLQEADQLQLAIGQLERSKWHTIWNDRQRRRSDEETAERNIPLHDRQE